MSNSTWVVIKFGDVSNRIIQVYYTVYMLYILLQDGRLYLIRLC